ncbi:MAG: hypothetical protein IJS61_09880, partial [Firmicutes bacterium]|nr:hypothetical protein [Bacillota bacterium]
MKPNLRSNIKKRIISAVAIFSIIISSLIPPVTVYSDDVICAPAGLEEVLDEKNDPAENVTLLEEKINDETEIEAEITTTFYYGDEDDKPEDEDIISGSGLVVSESGSGTTEENEYRRLNFELEPKEGASVVLEGLMPKNAQAEAVDVTDDCGENTIAAYDITITNNGSEYQPGEERPVSVT